MMRSIIKTSLRFRYLMVVASAVLLVFGGLKLRDTPIDVFPEFSPPRVEVQTLGLGLSAQEVEELITVPLEQGLAGLPHLEVAAVQVDPAAVVDRADLRTWYRRDRCQAPRSGAHLRRDADAAELGDSACNRAAVVGHAAGS